MSILFPGTYPISDAVEAGNIKRADKNIQQKKFMLRKRIVSGPRAGQTMLFTPKIFTAKQEVVDSVVKRLNSQRPMDATYEVFAREIT